MKLLTLNTHSLMEENYKSKLDIFVDAIRKHMPRVIALQEIMQPIYGESSNYPHINAGIIPLKAGNHALNIARRLEKVGIKYNLVWLGFKKSYDKFDEGLAILTIDKIEKIDAINLSPFNCYNNWKTRKALGVRINDIWYYSVHMGWWDDKDSPFQYELKSLVSALPNDRELWIMGDFNSLADEKNKGYDLITKYGFLDTYSLAINKDDGITAHTDIDGWKNGKRLGIRIDYIFTNKITSIESSLTIFNGINEEKISDHYGVMITKS